MQYCTFGKLDFRPAALGCGAMRLPALMDGATRPDSKRIDYPAATKMPNRAIDGGVIYVDTAWMQHPDTREAWLGKALTYASSFMGVGTEPLTAGTYWSLTLQADIGILKRP
jgi:predicted aldo/keto reductase-like oxidoreductase